MKWGKALLAMLLILVLVSFFTDIDVRAEKQRVYDDATLLSQDEVNELEKIAEQYSHELEIDFIILTSPDMDGKDIETFMVHFYDDKRIGYDEKTRNAAMLGLNMKSREVMTIGFGEIEERLRDRNAVIREEVTSDLSEGNYYSAFQTYIKRAAEYVQYKPGVDPNNPFFKTGFQLIFSIILSTIIVWFMARTGKTKVTTTAATYQDSRRTRIVQKRDTYVRTTVTKRRKPKQNNNRGGGSAGGGFTGVGKTGGGQSYSGSRGKF